jgi:hypothetical protein
MPGARVTCYDLPVDVCGHALTWISIGPNAGAHHMSDGPTRSGGSQAPFVERFPRGFTLSLSITKSELCLKQQGTIARKSFFLYSFKVPLFRQDELI